MIRLPREELVKAPTAGLVRLANFLQLSVTRGLNETEGQFRHRLINAIQRWEKLEEKDINETRENKFPTQCSRM